MCPLDRCSVDDRASTGSAVAGISIPDMQHAMRHADPRTTMRYGMAKANLDRHEAQAVAASPHPVAVAAGEGLHRPVAGPVVGEPLLGATVGRGQHADR